MPRVLISPVCLTGLLSLFFSTDVWAEGAASVWQTDFGSLDLTVMPNGDTQGIYPNYQGAFYGRLNGKTHEIEGVWVQPSSEVKCATKEHGSSYWGRVTWLVTEEGELIGNLSHCNQPRGSSGVWEGEMVTGTNPLSVLSDGGESVKEDSLLSYDVYAASRFFWGQDVLFDKVKVMTGDLSCDGKKDKVLAYLDVDSPDGPFLDFALLEPGEALAVCRIFHGSGMIVDGEIQRFQPYSAVPAAPQSE